MGVERTRQMGHSRPERAARMAPPLSWRFSSPRGGADRLYRGLLACASRGGMSGLRHLGPSLAGPALMGLILLAFSTLGAAPAQAQTVTTLVSNTDFGVLSAGVANIQAQSFTTGANGAGYEISEIRIRVLSLPLVLPDNSVKLRADDGGKPGGLVADLMDPATFVGANQSNTFTVPEGTILDPQTTYWVVVNEGVEVGSTFSYTATTFDSQTGEAGWSIGNGYLWKSAPNQDWSSSDNALLIAVRGLPGTPPGATDATLSEIVVNKKEVNDRGDEIVLEPAFSSDRTSYSFVVGRESSLFLTVRTTHPRATVRIFEGRLSHLETPPHLEGEVRHYAELMVQSLGGGRWSIEFNPSEGRYWIDVTVTSADEEHQVNYRLDYLARGRPPSLLWALIAPHGSRGTLDRVTLKYDKILRPDGPDPDNPLAPPASAFSVEVEGQFVAVTKTQINAEYLQLRLARELTSQEQQVTVGYARPATNPVQTNIGGLAFDFTDYPVDVSRAPTTNNSELSVADAEVTEGDGTMDFVVTLAPEQRPPAWVDYATADGTARAGEDYRATSGRVKFQKMETTKTVSVPIINDAVEEDGETFTLVLSDPDGALIADGEATGTIVDDGDEGVQPPRPPQNTGTELFSETMTVGYNYINTWAGYDDGSVGDLQIGMLPETGFSFGGTPYTVKQVTNVDPDARDSDAGQLALKLSGTLTQADAAPLDLYIGNTRFALAEADHYLGNRNHRAWDDSGLVLRSGSTILVRIVDRRPAMTGTFQNVPRNHNSPFTFEVHFSEEVVVSAETLRDHAFAVTNGEVTGARQLNPPSTMAWEIAVASFSEEAVTLVLPETTDCAAAGAICTEDGRPLSAKISAMVEGPPAAESLPDLTVSVESVPTTHDGTSAFDVRLAFSEELADDFSYKTLRDHAFTVTHGAVTGARRLTPASNIGWEITVEPAGRADVTLALPATTDCDAAGAICTEDERMLAATLVATVEGPAAAEPLPDLTVSVQRVPGTHDGTSAFDIRLAFSEELAADFSYTTLRDDAFTVTHGAVTGARRLNPPSNIAWEITVAPTGSDAVTLVLRATTDCADDGAICTEDGRMLAHSPPVTIPGPPVEVSVADARVEEGAGAVLAFVVTLERAVSGVVTVGYATSDGSALAGVDYTAASETLTFAAGESSQTIEVAVLDDAHDEGEETMALTLSNASSGARITDAEATGTIVNADPLPRALLARFGRTAAVHVVEHVEERLQAPREPGFRGRFAGRELRRGMERDMALSFLRELGGMGGVNPAGVHGAGMHSPGAHGPRSGTPGTRMAGAAPLGAVGLAGGGVPMGAAAGSLATAPGMGAAASPMGTGPAGGLGGSGLLQMGFGGGDMLTGSAFAMNRETHGGILSFWSRGAQSRFAGRDGALSLGGDVRTTMFGADYARGPLVAGLSLSHSRGLGEYAGVTGGQVASAVTGLYPWLGYQVTDRVSVWGVTGYGAGGMLLTPETGAALESGLSMAMAAAGTRGELIAGGAGGFELAFKADALWVGTAIDGVDGPTGRLAATAAAVTRFRTGLEGSRDYTLAGRLSLTPSVEVGLRQDGGDAETGAGMDLGAGLVVSDSSTGLAVDVRVRTLLVHQAEGFRERGMAVSLSYNPTPSTPLGVTARVAPSWGGEAASGAEALWGRETMAGMARGGVADGTRLDAEVGYGLPVGSRFVGTPTVGVGTSAYGRDYRLGYRLGALGGAGTTVEFGVDAQRRESPLVGGTDHGARAQATVGW